MSDVDELFIKHVIANNFHMVTKLLEAGANVHFNSDYALEHSADNSHSSIVSKLLEYGADVHADNDYALKWSAYNGNLSIVSKLLEYDADVHVENDRALRWGAKNGTVANLVGIGPGSLICSIQVTGIWRQCARSR